MGGKNVKITMAERLLRIVAPHPCLSCGKAGDSLCDNCKYDIEFDPFYGCVLCGLPQKDGVCLGHGAPFMQAHVASLRAGPAKVLIDALKFERRKEAAGQAAELLHHRLPCLPDGTPLVYIPTSPAHRRQRGYDQVELIAKRLAVLRGMKLSPLLVRRRHDVQHVASRRRRHEQAREAYALRSGATIVPNAVYVLLDDVITTGATVTEAAQLLRHAGARVVVAAVVYQPRVALS